MKRSGRICVLVVGCMAIGTAAVSAQNVAEESRVNRETQSVEELYLSQETTMESVAAMIESDDRESQLIALRRLESGAQNGLIDPASPEYVSMVGRILRQGVTTISRNSSRLPDSYRPILRVEAAQALALSGNADAARYLVEAIRNDPEPSVQAAAMRALSRSDGMDLSIASLEIALALRKEVAVRGDEAMIVAGMDSLRELASRGDPLAFDPLIRETAVAVAIGRFNRTVRESAINALMAM